MPLYTMRESLAIRHSDCLGWKAYTPIEKEELKSVIYQLSSSSKVKIYIWIFLNGFGVIVVSYSKTILFIKSFIKNILFRLRKEN